MSFFRSIVVVVALLLLAGHAGGCGGGSGGETDPLTVLEGEWFGRVIPGPAETIGLVLDGTGQITSFSKDGTPTTSTGALAHVSGPYFEGQLDGTDVRLFLDPSGRYAVFFGNTLLASLERDATALPPGPLQLSTVAPGEYVGTHLELDSNAAVAAQHAASAAVGAGGTYVGTDAGGRIFGSTAGNPLVPGTHLFEGGYEDNLNPSQGLIELIPSPDGLFHAVAAFPEMNTIFLNAAFIGAWNRK